MKSFNIYKNDTTYKAVKNGWCWPAFLFGSLWAIFAQIWLIGLLVLPIEIILQISASVTQNIHESASGGYAEMVGIIGGLISLFVLTIHIVFGLFGNSWSRNKLEKSGYTFKKQLDAPNKINAISIATREAF